MTRAVQRSTTPKVAPDAESAWPRLGHSGGTEDAVFRKAICAQGRPTIPAETRASRRARAIRKKSRRAAISGPGDVRRRGARSRSDGRSCHGKASHPDHRGLPVSLGDGHPKSFGRKTRNASDGKAAHIHYWTGRMAFYSESLCHMRHRFVSYASLRLAGAVFYRLRFPIPRR